MNRKEQLEYIINNEGSCPNCNCHSCCINNGNSCYDNKTSLLRATKMYNDEYGSTNMTEIEELKEAHRVMGEKIEALETVESEKTNEDKVIKWWESIVEKKLVYKDEATTFENFLNDAYEHEEEYIVEKTIEKVIEYYNDGWTPDWDNRNENKFRFCYENSDKTLHINKSMESQYLKSSLYMKSVDVARQVRKVLTNFKGKNFLQKHFTGAW